MIDFEKYSKKFINLYTDEIPEILLKFLEKDNKNLALGKNFVSSLSLGNKLNLSVLDLGCGDGALLVALYNRGYLKKMRRIVGVDLSAERLERLKSKAILKLELICSDACDVRQLEDSTFDYIFSESLIEHVPDDKALLAEIRRLLKKDGILYISSIVKKKYGWYIYRCNNKWVRDPTHIREYSSEQEFISLIEDSGLKIIESKMKLCKFHPVEFLVRRIYFPIFKAKNINSFFLNHRILNKLRFIKIPVIGYYNIEVVAKK